LDDEEKKERMKERMNERMNEWFLTIMMINRIDKNVIGDVGVIAIAGAMKENNTLLRLE
jgi:hypothetical protein